MQKATGNIQSNSYVQLDLFAICPPVEPPFKEIKVSPVLAAQARANKALALIKSVAAVKHPMVVAWSGGKDSGSVLNLTLIAMKELAEERREVQPLIILHADTLVENPEMAAYTHQEMEAIKAYAGKHNIPIEIHVSKPALLSQWAVKIVSGRNLPVFANKGSRDCTMDLKVEPMGKIKKRIMKRLGKDCKHEPVTILGTRFAESAGRKKRMEGRGETADAVWSDKEGLKLSPIADWTYTDLWAYLQACSTGRIESYGDFSGLIDLYTAGASKIETNDEGTTVPTCRFGCAICTVGRDRSMEAMLAKGRKYAYMQPLYDLQRFLVNTQYDLDRRQWVGRSIKEGKIAIAPDTYSPAMLEELLRIILTIDVREKEAAYRLGIAPRFELISLQGLIAIDAIWSQQGINKAFHALSIYRDIYIDGQRHDVPATVAGKPVAIPEPRYLEVGEGWKERGGKYEFCGLRDVTLEMVCDSDAQSGCMGHKNLKDGRVVLDAEMSEGEFTVDEESAAMVLEFELDYLIDLGKTMPRNYAMRHYTTLGTLKFAKSQMGTTDMIMRRTAFKDFEGILDATTEELLAKTA